MEQNFEDMSRKAQYKLLWDEYLGKREGAKKTDGMDGGSRIF